MNEPKTLSLEEARKEAKRILDGVKSDRESETPIRHQQQVETR